MRRPPPPPKGRRPRPPPPPAAPPPRRRPRGCRGRSSSSRQCPRCSPCRGRRGRCLSTCPSRPRSPCRWACCSTSPWLAPCWSHCWCRRCRGRRPCSDGLPRSPPRLQSRRTPGCPPP
ncbi:hypothetical protein DEF23_23255 [Marinitenerispora sediminis]|nr:hypothetical protein DEF23_23255 [Marinitenerispora sediminis]